MLQFPGLPSSVASGAGLCLSTGTLVGVVVLVPGASSFGGSKGGPLSASGTFWQAARAVDPAVT
jgi:hypothetical protein